MLGPLVTGVKPAWLSDTRAPHDARQRFFSSDAKGGVQGFLKLSFTLLGPNDKPRLRDEDEDDEGDEDEVDEDEDEDNDGKGDDDDDDGDDDDDDYDRAMEHSKHTPSQPNQISVLS